MDKNVQFAGQLTHKVGSTLYRVNVYFDTESRESLEDKIIRLVCGDLCFENPKNGLTNGENCGIMDMLQMDRLPERGAL